MSGRRIGVLFFNEASQGRSNLFFVLAIVMPVVLSFVLSLVFGSLFSDTPRLGIFDAGNSTLGSAAAELQSIESINYGSNEELITAVENGDVDLGVALPAEFDQLIASTNQISLDAYIWGESLARNRAVLATALVNLVRRIGGQEAPVEVRTVTLGDGEAVAVEDRLLPFMLLISILLAGTMIPASSLVNERQKGTLAAVTTTPASLGDVLFSKGAIGVILSIIMAAVTIFINGALGGDRALLFFVLAFGALFAAQLGILLGSLTKDITSLFAMIKGLGLLLYAPAIIYLFPELPEWIGRVFPTYYVIAPVMDITQHDAGWSDIAANAFVLIGLNLVLFVAISFSSRQLRLQAA